MKDENLKNKENTMGDIIKMAEDEDKNNIKKFI
jgi:hypothetical protein